MAYRDSTTASGSSATPAVAVPAGVQSGDIVILVCNIDASTAAFDTADYPTGFTELAEVQQTFDGEKSAVGWKRLTGADSGSYTFGNVGASGDWVCQAFAFSGRHATNPPVISTGATGSTSGGTSVSVVANGVTAVAGDDLLWICAPDVNVSGSGNGTTPPASYTEAEDAENLWSNLSGAYRQNVSAGATGTVTGTFAYTANTGWLAWLVRIPAAPSGTDLTVTPGTPNVDWAGSTPTLGIDAVRTPGTPNVAWAGSTAPAKADISRSPGTPTVAWTGSTPTLTTTSDLTLTPGTPDVAWSGSTPTVTTTGDLTLTPGTPAVAWTGSTPTLTLEGLVTLTPGTATVDWTGSTAPVIVTPDVVPEPPEVGGGAAFTEEEDFTEVEVRNLTLRPGPAVVKWTGSRAYVRVVPDPKPLRFRLPRPARKPAGAFPEPEAVVDLTLRPGPAVVAWGASEARLTIRSYAPVEELEAAKARIAELERELEEETAVLAALAAG